MHRCRIQAAWSALFCALFSGASLGATPKTGEPILTPMEAALVTPRPPVGDAVASFKSGMVRVDTAALFAAVTPLPRRTSLSLFADLRLEVILESAATRERTRRTFTGRLADEPGSSVTLAVVGGVLAGSIRTQQGRLFELRPAGNSSCFVHEVDQRRLQRCLTPRESRGDVELYNAADASPAGDVEPFDAPPATGCDDGTVIDLMVVYTATARQMAGGTPAIEAMIDLAVADTNAAFDRSLIDTHIRLVHTHETPYTETGDFVLDFERLLNPADGHLDEVPILRNQHGADCVSLWQDNFGGAGYGWFPDLSLKGAGASGITIMGFRGAPYLTLAHELGHNLWCAHDRLTHDQNEPNDVPFAHYSFGYREPGNAWHDIMAYPPGEVIPYFANPNVIWPGPNPPNPGPTGIPENQPDPADLALTINQTRHIVANFRPTAFPGLPEILYVRTSAPAGGDGLTWATAISDLQDALCRAAGSNGAVREIWVAAGTYQPGRGGDDRLATFQLVNGLAIYGGFAGNETLRGQRDPAAQITTLSGDIGVSGDAADNSFHVLTGSGTDSTAILDGFTITGGRADGGTGDDDFGGGLFNRKGSPTMANCRFIANQATYGGAVYNWEQAGPSFTDCVFEDNHALATFWPAGGGAIYNYDRCSPVLTRCTFNGNTGNIGAAVAGLYDSNPAFSECTFAGNAAGGSNAEGGGAYFFADCRPSFDGCTFEGNFANSGGGAFAHTNCALTLTGCTFKLNSCDDGGGAIHQYKGPLTLADCNFEANSADFGGGLLAHTECEVALTRCTFFRNHADSDGGGLYSYNQNQLTASHCAFVENSASFGGGIASLFGASSTLANCTLRKNSSTGDAGAMANYVSSPATLVSCLVTGNRAEVSAGAAVGNWFDSNPVLINCTLTGNVSGWTGSLYSYQSSPTLANTILWDNRFGTTTTETAQITTDQGATTVEHCIVQGWTGALGGTANSGASPQFSDGDGPDNQYGTLDDDPRPVVGSPAIDTGSSAALPPDFHSDLDGGPRVLGVAVDRGAYEFVPLIPGDFDRDGDVDSNDLAGFVSCVSGPAIPRASSCAAHDLDADGDVDQSDYGRFQECISGTDRPALPDCGM